MELADAVAARSLLEACQVASQPRRLGADHCPKITWLLPLLATISSRLFPLMVILQMVGGTLTSRGRVRTALPDKL